MTVKQKRIAAVFCFLIVVCLAKAQNHWQAGFQMQPIGVTMPDIWPHDGPYADPPVFGLDHGFSYKMGLVAFRELGRFFWLESGLVFSRKKFNSFPIRILPGQAATDTLRMTTRLSDVQVPLGLQFRYDLLRWGFIAAPHVYTGFRLRGNNTFSEHGSDYPPEVIRNRRVFLPAFFGFGFTTGLSYRPARKITLMLDLGVDYEFASHVARMLIRIPANGTYFTRLVVVHDVGW